MSSYELNEAKQRINGDLGAEMRALDAKNPGTPLTRIEVAEAAAMGYLATRSGRQVA